MELKNISQNNIGGIMNEPLAIKMRPKTSKDVLGQKIMGTAPLFLICQDADQKIFCQ